MWNEDPNCTKEKRMRGREKRLYRSKGDTVMPDWVTEQSGVHRTKKHESIISSHSPPLHTATYQKRMSQPQSTLTWRPDSTSYLILELCDQSVTRRRSTRPNYRVGMVPGYAHTFLDSSSRSEGPEPIHPSWLSSGTRDRSFLYTFLHLHLYKKGSSDGR